ncbi:hypothetical protein DPMN_057344 [Dreissena polymorpha]|uniref:Uncharacterized protein n=1 Tax=Dreissena polymorpha TaxID=45954 RepID=A0A9D4C001_DREPO|nr:hypothetical protein DPMN_057344 [Dreissena polymorpha]
MPALRRSANRSRRRPVRLQKNPRLSLRKGSHHEKKQPRNPSIWTQLPRVSPSYDILF